MKEKTELTIRTIAKIDPGINPLNLERAIGFLYGRPLYTHDLVHVVRSKDACRILGISYSHLQHCIARGYLDKVYGAGKLGIGVTAESITRFTTLRTRRTSGKERTK